jgi:hypothetical protein
MDTSFYKFIAILFFASIPFSLFPQNTNSEVKVKESSFTIPSRGVKVYEIRVPKGVKRVRAVLSNQTEMINLEILGPTNVSLCKTTTWSYMSNWRKPLNCSASVVNNDRQSPGIWTIKITGAVHKGKLDKVRSVSGKLAIYFTGGSQEEHKTNHVSGFPITKEYSFTVASRGEKTYEINVPDGSKKIRAILSDQTEMISMELLGPTNTRLCQTTTWSNMSNWRKPLNCSASVVNNNRQRPGIWKVIIKGAVHKGKLDKVKTVNGKLKVIVSD